MAKWLVHNTLTRLKNLTELHYGFISKTAESKGQQMKNSGILVSQRKDEDNRYAQKCESCSCVEEGVCRVLHVCCGAVGNKAVSTGALPVIAHLGTHTELKG